MSLTDCSTSATRVRRCNDTRCLLLWHVRRTEVTHSCCVRKVSTNLLYHLLPVHGRPKRRYGRHLNDGESGVRQKMARHFCLDSELDERETVGFRIGNGRVPRPTCDSKGPWGEPPQRRFAGHSVGQHVSERVVRPCKVAHRGVVGGTASHSTRCGRRVARPLCETAPRWNQDPTLDQGI